MADECLLGTELSDLILLKNDEKIKKCRKKTAPKQKTALFLHLNFLKNHQKTMKKRQKSAILGAKSAILGAKSAKSAKSAKVHFFLQNFYICCNYYFLLYVLILTLLFGYSTSREEQKNSINANI